MPGIRITGTFKRGVTNESSFAITKADALLIPIQIATDINARDTLEEYLRMSFMLCYVISTGQTYRLGSSTEIATQVWTQDSGDYILVTEKGAPGGVVPLDANAKINPIYLDTLNLSSTYVVADIAEMLALTTYKGNLIIVQDASADPDVPSGSATYARTTDIANPTLADDFLRVEFGASVTSVNGLIGVVSIDFSQLLSWGSSQTQFNTAVDTNLTVLQNAADIQANQTAISILQTDKADIVNVLTLANITPFTPTDDYNPSTKKYVDDAVAGLANNPDGVQGSIQTNDTNLFRGFTNFTYLADVMSVPTIKLTTIPATDNALTNVLVRAADGTLKLREVASLGGGSGGHVIQNEGIDVTNRNNLNFVGNLVNLTDDLGNDAIIVNILNPNWGDIGGIISDQTDLQGELNDKADKIPTEAHIAEVAPHIDWAIAGGEEIEVTRLPPAASSDAHYFENIPVGILAWNINHNLGKRPAVLTTDVDGNEFYGSIEHTDNNNLIVTYSTAVSGNIYLN